MTVDTNVFIAGDQSSASRDAGDSVDTVILDVAFKRLSTLMFSLQEISHLPVEILEIVLIRSFLMLYSRDCRH